ncbi:hypothetical protein HKBW3S33_00767, partial [Candidatus Hakubella thermalkaliphila]
MKVVSNEAPSLHWASWVRWGWSSSCMGN